MTDRVADARLAEIETEYAELLKSVDDDGSFLIDGPGAASAFYGSLSLSEVVSLCDEVIEHRRSQDAGGWREASEVPQVPVRGERYFIVAVKRAHSGKTVSFPALYLHDYPLNYDDGDRCVCDDPTRHTDDGCPTTGWFQAEANDDGDGQRYSRLHLDPGDELVRWTDVPRFVPSSPTMEPTNAQ
jgi:hypothetical protein